MAKNKIKTLLLAIATCLAAAASANAGLVPLRMTKSDLLKFSYTNYSYAGTNFNLELSEYSDGEAISSTNTTDLTRENSDPLFAQQLDDIEWESKNYIVTKNRSFRFAGKDVIIINRPEQISNIRRTFNLVIKLGLFKVLSTNSGTTAGTGQTGIVLGTAIRRNYYSITAPLTNETSNSITNKP